MQIVFDFDGVLCEYSGWRGHDEIGRPNEGVIELVKELFEQGYDLKLSTTRLNPYPFGENNLMKGRDEVVASGRAKEIIMNWLQEHDILKCFKEITGYKPFGDVYIDDRALRYDSTDWVTHAEKKDIARLQNQLHLIYEDSELEYIEQRNDEKAKRKLGVE